MPRTRVIPSPGQVVVVVPRIRTAAEAAEAADTHTWGHERAGVNTRRNDDV